MRIAVDFNVLGTEAALRGMGRYTQQQIFEALRTDPSLEVFPLVRGKLDPAKCLYDWLAMPRVHPILIGEGKENIALDALHSHEHMMLHAHELQTILRNLGADLFHNATPFMPPTYTSLTRVPVVATCYDLIPLIFPSDYFRSVRDRDVYYRCLRNVRAATRVAAISYSAATDLQLYTGYSAEQIDIAYPFVEAVFRPGVLDAALRESACVALRHTVSKLPERFMLSVTGIHRSKNAQFLLDSFAAAQRLPGWPGLKLVIVLPAKWTIPDFHERFGNPAGVLILADVAEEVLRDLYISAEFVFQPSLYEGFGYPVAEAMSCGAAVIATRTASIPEIAGDAALLVGPTDRNAGASAIHLLATDTAVRDRLRTAAAERMAATFSDPAMLGSATARIWHAAAASMAAAPRSRVALWSSMPPLDCGIADYTAELADALADNHEVDVYTDGNYMPTPRAAPNIHFRHVKDFDPAELERSRRIFQLQARDYQAFMYPEILAHGGTVMLHDIILADAIMKLERHLGRYGEFKDRMLAAEGHEAVCAFHRVLARSGSPPNGPALDVVFDKYPMLRWAVGGDNHALVHTDTLAHDLLRHYPDVRVRVVRHGFGDQLPHTRHLPLPLWRRRLGLSSGLIVGTFGIVGRNKRIEQVIAGFEHLWQHHEDSLLVIVGRAYDRAYAEALHARISASPAAARIVMTDYAPPDVFHALMALCDVLVNLRWPALGGVSGILIRALAAGKPTIVSDIPDWRELGDAACLRVAPDDTEVETIAGHLLRLAADPTERAQLSQTARAWFAREATIDIMVADYLAGGRPPSDPLHEGRV